MLPRFLSAGRESNIASSQRLRPRFALRPCHVLLVGECLEMRRVLSSVPQPFPYYESFDDLTVDDLPGWYATEGLPFAEIRPNIGRRDEGTDGGHLSVGVGADSPDASFTLALDLQGQVGRDDLELSFRVKSANAVARDYLLI
ncbi:MAG: hypothetical protein KDA60_03090, partial [Planctomycetales bacterium]|nr:hypothetical protein [Planctomycetales bacterium]